jgi:hypothetical protein
MVSSLERVLAFFFGPDFYAYASGTTTSAEASVAYAATDTCLVKLQHLIFLLNLHFYISQVYVGCGAGGSCEFVSAASAKVEILRIPVVLMRFLYPMINGSIAELFFYCYR